ncbi:MAG: hydrolase [Candidatus Binatia bacterium]|nr:MAG: hydrolase [Candidatus Binatia bacterium]
MVASPVAERKGLLPGLRTAVLALLTLGRSYRKFDWRTGEDERHSARSPDGWNLGLYRYRPRSAPKPCPVVCGHGLAGSRLVYDLHPDFSLARFLAERGFDTWLLDFRGRQASWPDGGPDPTLQWCFDDFVRRDFPAAVARVCEVTSARELFWVGLEISGQTLYAAAIEGRAPNVRGAVTLGAPLVTPETARVPGVTAPPKTRRGARVPYRSGARLAGPVLAYAGARVLESSFRPENADPLVVARYFRNGVPDEATDLVDQVASWIRSGRMADRKGRVVYSDRASEIRLPLLFLVGAHDLQRPPESVRSAWEAVGSRDKTLVVAGKEHGFGFDFGHDDLVAGLRAPTEIFPRIAEWLERRS